MIDHHPSGSPSTEFDIYETYQRILKNVELSPPLAAILSLTALIEKSRAGTMFELVKALNKGAETLKSRSSNPISLNAGCELFIAFVTLFPHESSSFSQLKRELVKQGETYVNQVFSVPLLWSPSSPMICRGLDLSNENRGTGTRLYQR